MDELLPTTAIAATIKPINKDSVHKICSGQVTSKSKTFFVNIRFYVYYKTKTLLRLFLILQRP